MVNREILIKSVEALHEHLTDTRSLEHCTLQNLDLREEEFDFSAIQFGQTVLLGCLVGRQAEIALRAKGAKLFPLQHHLPYNPYRHSLYTWQELREGFTDEDDQSTDRKIYDHFVASRFNPDINEALSQRIHDHAIDDALRDLLGMDEKGMTAKKCVGIMGGHSTRRDDLYFHKTAHLAHQLAQAGFYVVSGGGPGIMEAANLGAYLGQYPATAVDDALAILEKAPTYQEALYDDQSLAVLEKYPLGTENLAVPTWFYGHEPSNLFASHIAKYFSNSLREDHLLAISLYGVVFAPGSAGTTQEIFQDAAQNHYATYGYYSPMVFMGKERYEISTSLYPVLKQLAYGKAYYDLLGLFEEPGEVVDFILQHPPVKADAH
ncbi:MAG: hypothetical protein AAFR61_12680 [Bacteroidota bacterium]